MSKGPELATLSPMRQTPAISAKLTPLNAESSLPFRQAPHNIEAEQALLGAVLINNEAFDRVSAFLEPHHFFDPLHGRIFETAAKLIQSGKHATPVTLKTFFDNEEPIGGITVPQYLGRLAAHATSVINAEDYGRTVYDLSVRRDLIIIGEDMVNVAYDSPVDMPPERQIEESERRLYSLAEKGKYGSGFLSFSHALTDAIDMASKAYQREGGLSGLSTGLRDLDRALGGLQKSDLVILAGRPSMGKTSLATNIAFNIAKAYRAEMAADGMEEVVDGAVVGFFSLEMSAEQLATRIISEQAQIPSEKIRRGLITEDEFHRLVERHPGAAVAAALYRPHRRHLHRPARGTRPQAEAPARPRPARRRLSATAGRLGKGAVRGPRPGGHRDHHRAEGAGQGAGGAGHGALSQLSRQVENREDKRPQLSDLRESGSIEQDADVVMFVFREEYYVQRPGADDHQGRGASEMAG